MKVLCFNEFINFKFLISGNKENLYLFWIHLKDNGDYLFK